ncbi:MAG: 4Fe-4S binding protein [Planctomycetes bacterium]|nr:4Fe-4S binding protein [Planctomycetota bacterium]
MAMRIDADQCIDCGACVEPCPNQAIRRGGEEYTLKNQTYPALSDKFYVIHQLCTQCVGYYDEPQCVNACPVDCITADAAHEESHEQLEAKAKNLKPQK